MKNLQDFAVQDYLRIVRRRLWYWIIPTVLISIGTGVYAWRLPSVYKSETTILVADRLLPEDYIGSLVRQSVMDHIEFARQQLRSRTFVERIAQEFQMGGNGINPEAIQNFVISNTEVTVLPPNIFKLAFYSTDPSTAQAVTRRLAERVMQSNIALRQERVQVVDEFLDEQLRQADDDLAQAERKLADFNQKTFPGLPQQGINIETLNSLQGQLAVDEGELKAAYDQRSAYDRILTEHQETKQAAKQAVSQQPTTPATTQATPAVPDPPAPSPLDQRLGAKQQELSALLTKYKPEHPDVLRLKREIRDLQSEVAAAPPPARVSDVPQATEVKPDARALPEIDVAVDFYEAEVKAQQAELNRQIERMEANKKEHASKVTAYSRRLNMPTDVLQEMATLTQDRDLAKQKYSYLSAKKLNSDLSGKVDTDTNNKTFSTIDPPNLPQLPVRPDRPTLTAVGSLAGLLLGFAFAFVREVLDPALSDQDSAAAELKLPVLTAIPAVGSRKREEVKLARKRKKETLAKRNKPHLLLNLATPHEPAASFSIQDSDRLVGDVVFGRSRIAAEQYQMLRTTLNVQRQRGVRSLLVTSAIPDEGKTFVACCLAAMLAKEQDKKVLLIDGDLRTGSAGQAMHVEDSAIRPGLSNVLTGEADIENCLIPCSDLNLSFLPAGSVVENPVELLSSPRLQQTMHDLALLFDWVIVDSPPVLPIADSSVLNPVCDAAIVVVRADKTPASLVKEAINKVGREKVTGVVMNCVREIKATHYYGHYYTRLAETKK